MAINFPASPSSGQTFMSGKTLYTFSNGAWRSAVGAALPFNYFGNPSMQVSQQNTSAGTVSGYYFADQWFLLNSTAMTHMVARAAVVTPRGSPWRARLANTSAGTPASGTDCNFQHAVEGTRFAPFQWGTASAKQAVVRFGFKGPAGTYSACFRNNAVDRSYVVNFTISAGQADTDTEQIIVVPGDTTGTWIKDSSARGLTFTVQIAGNLTAGVANAWQAGNFQITAANTNPFSVFNNTFEFFDAGLYLDPNLTGRPPPWEYINDRQATIDSQRYWNKFMVGRGVATSATAGSRIGGPLMNTMRAAPALTLAGSPTLYDATVNNALTSITTSFAIPSTCEFTGASTGMTATRALCMPNSTQTNYIACNARL